ncbi:hypothetical protein OS493_007192 [Desmophyllum pertusum]|uniref:Uncharacterized protein n=1 Tax=Desmophyllum pertusum TaxID=174260 RepID=A0A9W9ZG35_9CNID|nr:hypothetical protein OS493_007192 [Desmophyllum pertusum]
MAVAINFPAQTLFFSKVGAWAIAQNCNFESGLCNYKQDKSDRFDWRWYHGQTGSSGTGPTIDHTPKSKTIYTIGGNSNTGAACVFPFTYRFTTYTKCTNAGHTQLWCPTTKNYAADGKWGNCVPSSVYPYGCYLSYGKLFASTLPQINNKNDVIQQCINAANKVTRKNFQGIGITKVGSSTYNCYADVNADLQYNRYGSFANCGSDGLGAQNTNGTAVFLFTARYVYIEASSPQRRGDFARLSSPVVSVSQQSTKCLKFWYHMYGPHVDTLNVYTNTSSTGSLIKQLNINKTQGNQWKQAQVDITMSQAYSLVFEGVRGRSYRGDIAVDDIELNNGSCTKPGGVCDFQQDLCSYTQDKTDDFDWTRSKGQTPTSGTGPLTDHTLGTGLGYYILFEATGQSAGDKARLMRSYPKTPSTGNCLTFWYMMYGSSLGTLNVYQKVGSNLGSAIWNISGDQGRQRTWLKGQVTLNSTSQFSVS